MKRLALIIAFLLAGCSTLEKPETFAVCKAADVVTTVVAVHSGAGAEVNPLLKPIVGSMTKLTLGTVAPLIAVSFGIAWLVKQVNNPTVTAAATVATCGVAAHNLLVLR